MSWLRCGFHFYGNKIIFSSSFSSFIWNDNGHQLKLKLKLWTSTLSIVTFPYLITSLNRSIFSMRFAQILKDDTSFTANAVGVALSIVYFALYFNYMSSSQKSAEMPKILYTGSFIIAVLVYSKVKFLLDNFWKSFVIFLFYSLKIPRGLSTDLA